MKCFKRLLCVNWTKHGLHIINNNRNARNKNKKDELLHKPEAIADGAKWPDSQRYPF